MNYYQKPISQILNELNTSAEGFSDSEALLRLKKYGLNQLKKVKKRPLILKFFAQFFDLLAVILIIIGILAIFTEEPRDSLIIFSIVFINAIIGFVQEYKAERILSAFKKHIPSFAKVIREGKLKRILSAHVVPGDILVVESGDAICADARLIEAFNLKTNDFALTGESEPQPKRVYQIKETKSLTDIDNMIFMGTSVAEGEAKAVVVETGMETAFGKIAKETQATKEELTPLQKELRHTGKTVAKIATLVAVLILFVMYFIRRDLKESMLFAIAAGAAMVPEGLPAAISIALSLGAQRMLKKRALVKKLLHVESLGSVTTICTDKTGTLTTGEMTVIESWIKNTSIDLLNRTMVLCNNASLAEKPLGNPLEIALLKYAQKKRVQVDKIRREYQRVFEIPFSSKRKMMSVVCQEGKHYIAYVKGAPLEILERCKLKKEEKEEIIQENDRLANAGLRVLAFAYKDLGTKRQFQKEIIEQNLKFIGLVGIEDPPREGVKEAIALCKKAQIKVIMVTGDYGLTALAIAKQIGLYSKATKVITGEEMHRMDDEKLKEFLVDGMIFARIDPSQKFRIVENLKEKGEVVAVTGDGVNDAPALVAADIGVAMGRIGTDVAKEAADMVLLDDHFATIVKAIKEGRTIFDNAKKIIFYVFSSNAGELLVPIFGLFLGLPLPLLAIQMLAIDLGTDVFPSLALGVEKEEPFIMTRPPRPATERMMNIGMLFRLLFVGLIMGTLAFLVYLISLFEGGWRWGELLNLNAPLYLSATASAYATLVLCQVANAFSCRSPKFSLFKIGIWTNPYLLYAELISSLMLFGVVYFPPLQKIFRTDAPSPLSWVLIILSFFIFLFLSEWRKRSFKNQAT